MPLSSARSCRRFVVAVGLVRGSVQHDPSRLITPIVIAIMTYVMSGDADRGVTVRSDGVIQRGGRKETFIPASEITDISLQVAPGVFTSAMVVSFVRGRFETFEVLRPRVKKNPERRAALEEKVLQARQILALT